MEPVTACRAFASKRPVESQATRGPYRMAESSVSILCQHHELLNGTMGQTGLDVDAAKLLNRLTLWPMVTVGPWPAENSKTFGLTPVGVRVPLPAPYKIKHLFSRRNAFSRVSALLSRLTLLLISYGNG
jgi:hypothetical protein